MTLPSRRTRALYLAGVLALVLPLCPPAQARNLSASDMAIAAAAFKAADHGQWDAAEQLAATASDPLPAKILRWADDQRPGSGHGFDEIAGFVRDNPDWPLLNVLRVRAEDVMASEPDTSVRPFLDSYKPITPMARLRQAALLDAAGQSAQAAALVRDTWINGDFGAEDESQVLARYAAILTQDDQVKRLDRLVWDGKSDEARRMFSRVPDDWRQLAEARLKLAGETKDAQAAAERVPSSLQNDPGLAFERMRWQRRKGNDSAAADILEHQQDLGRPQAWWAERQVLTRHLLQAGDAARAYRLVNDHRLSDPSSVADAEFTAGWIALRFLKAPADAAPHFARLADTAHMPISLARGAYWAGRAADALGKPQDALAWYTRAAVHTGTYYGQLAATMPGVLPPPTPQPEPRAGAAATAAFQNRELVRAVTLLNALGEPDRMKPFLVRLADNAQTPEDFALLADLAEAIGRPDLGVSEAKRAAAVGVTLLRAGYPICWVPRNAGTEQALLLALTRQESAFELRAVSPSGALGLMQLMPGTAGGVAKDLGESYSRDRVLTDGEFNVTLGQAYFDSLLATFNGSYILSIAAYNAGPARVQQWLDTYGDPRTPGVDAVDWVESIPYGETRNYVQRVLENLQVYRLRIGDRTLAFSLEADLRR